MFKKISVLLVLNSIIVSSGAEALTVCDGNQTYASASENKCQIIRGGIEIKNTSLKNLDGLKYLEEVNYLVITNNYDLVSIAGLANLRRVNGILWFEFNGIKTISLPKLQVVQTFFIIHLSSMVSASFNKLSSVLEAFIIMHNNNLKEINLNGIREVGLLQLTNNPMLRSINGLENLERAYDIHLQGNYSVDEIKLSSLSYVSYLMFRDNSLKSISANNIQEVKVIKIQDEQHLTAVSFDNLMKIHEQIYLSRTALSDLTGFSSVIFIGDSTVQGRAKKTYGCDGTLVSEPDNCQKFKINYNLFVNNNKKLKSLDGLEKLSAINGSISLNYNESLIDLNGMKNVMRIGKDLNVSGQLNLISLNGLENLCEMGGFLIIEKNSQLTDISSLRNLAFIGHAAHITLNQLLCNEHVKTVNSWDEITTEPSENMLMGNKRCGPLYIQSPFTKAVIIPPLS